VPNCESRIRQLRQIVAKKTQSRPVQTYGTATDTKYPSAGFPETAYELTGISGTFSDSNHGLNIVNAPDTLTKTGPADPSNTDVPADLSSIDPSDPSNLLPPFSFVAVTYDNLYWPGEPRFRRGLRPSGPSPAVLSTSMA